MTSVLYYGLFVSLASVISFEDWRERKIRNHLILLGLAACAAGFAFLLLNSVLGANRARLWMLGEYYLPLRFYPKLIAHVALSLAAGIGFWRWSVWPAGDAKFFALAAFFTALIDPNLPGFPFLLCLVLLINIFVPAGLVFTAETLVKLALSVPRLRGVDWGMWLKANGEVISIRAREMWPHRAEYLILIVNLFAFFFALQTALSRFNHFIREPWGSLAIFVLMFAGWGFLVGVLRNKLVGIVAFSALCLAAPVGLLYLHWDVRAGLISAGRMTLNFGMLLSVGRLLFAWIIERDSLRELRAEDLKYGDILSDATWAQVSAEKELAGKIGKRYVDGLSHADVAALKEWLALRPAPGYSVYHTIPFALWIFLGTLLTISYRGSVVTALAPYFIRAQEILCRR
ncbi:MAG: hypothetical protein NUW21_11025 [Elusimicrobia bacterium]|nr:hypothetical protein [Elusimicrobiota bacterium]